MIKKIVIGFFVGNFLILVIIASAMASIFGSGSSGSSTSTVVGLPECIKEEMVIAALRCQSNYGHPASVTLAQIIQESTGKNDGLSGLAYNHKNLFGIKAGSSWKGKVAKLNTKEQLPDGTIYTITANFRAYDTYTESIMDRSKVLQNSSYYPIAGVTDAKEFAKCLKAWATGIDYTETLISHMDKYNLYIYDTLTEETYTSSVIGNGGGAAVIEKAKTKLGLPYVWGGGHSDAAIKDPNQAKFDCSSFVCWSYYQAGYDIGNQTTKGLIKTGREVSQADAQPGDIVLFAAYPGSSVVTHVGIFLGNGTMIHAPSTGDVIKISTLSAGQYSRLLCYRRLI